MDSVELVSINVQVCDLDNFVPFVRKRISEFFRRGLVFSVAQMVCLVKMVCFLVRMDGLILVTYRLKDILVTYRLKDMTCLV